MITLKNVTLRRGAKVLLDSVVRHPQPRREGRPGRPQRRRQVHACSRLLNGSLHEDGGDFSVPAQWRMAQVAQDMPETERIGHRLRAGRRHAPDRAARGSWPQRRGPASDGMAHRPRLHSDLADAGEHDAVPRAQALILGLGFRTDELEQPGQQLLRRLAHAPAAGARADVPVATCCCWTSRPTTWTWTRWSGWKPGCKRYAGTLIVISHDREFLDAVTNVTLHIEQPAAHALRRQLQRASRRCAPQQLELQQAAFSKQQDKIAHLQKFIDRFKAKASKAKQAQSRVKALERMEKIAPVLADAEFTFEFKEPANLPNPMLAISDASFGYAGRGRAAQGHPARRQPLGAGRPAHRHPGRQRPGQVDAGEDHRARRCAPLARHDHRRQGPDHRLLRAAGAGRAAPAGHAAGAHDAPGARARARPGKPTASRSCATSWAASTSRGDMVKQAVGTMSGGEKARLVLAMIVWQRPNLLLLDEPTNHLDLATREALAMALNEFEGTVMLVSHDRALLRAVCDEFWLVGRGVRRALRRRPGRLPALPAGRSQAPARGGTFGRPGAPRLRWPSSDGGVTGVRFAATCRGCSLIAPCARPFVFEGRAGSSESWMRRSASSRRKNPSPSKKSWNKSINASPR